MGEAGTCGLLNGFFAMVAVAYVFQRNSRMNGWQSPPSDEARLAATFWWLFPDETCGAQYVFSFQDLRQSAVQAIVRERGPPKVIYRCTAGGLAFY